MTKYWPFSTIKNSPLLPPVYAWDASRIYNRHQFSFPFMVACTDVARQTAPIDMPGLAIVESVGAPARRIYLCYPEFEEWMQLERGGVVLGSDGMLGVIVDGLH